MLQGHVSSKDAHEMMMIMVMPCHDHAQLMLICLANTWGVTTTMNPILDTYYLSHYEYAFHLNMSNNLMMLH
jgi:hypothetical protein